MEMNYIPHIPLLDQHLLCDIPQCIPWCAFYIIRLAYPLLFPHIQNCYNSVPNLSNFACISAKSKKPLTKLRMASSSVSVM